MNFEEAERQYQALVSQWQAGSITAEGFNQALDQLQVQSQDGTWWRMSTQDGSWLYWDGTTWQPAIPPHKAYPTAAPLPTAGLVPPTDQPEPKKRRRWLTACLVIVMLSCCCLSTAAVGGYFAVQAGSMSAMQLSSSISGAADVHVANLDDFSLSIELEQLDVSDEESYYDSMSLESFDMGSFASLRPGRYRIDFGSAGNPLTTLVCSIQADRGDVFQFVAVPEGIAVSEEGESAQTPDDLDARTSSLCQR